MKANPQSLSICLLAIALFSCSKRDNIEPEQAKVSAIEIASNPGYGPTIKKFVFEYDQQGRVSAVNDRRFFYREGSKVAYSRIARTMNIGGNLPYITDRTSEYIERLRFEWDGNGRISRIVADSIYSHIYTGTGSDKVTESESLQTGFVIAAYEYNGNGRLPASITSSNQRETVYFEYQGDNVSHTYQPGELPGPGYPSTSTIVVYTWYRYTDKRHYLYSIYKQLGFHPLDFSSVVSANTPGSFYNRLGTLADTSVTPDWSSAAQLEAIYDASGNVTQLRSSLETITISYY